MKTNPQIGVLLEASRIEYGYAHINARAIVLDGRNWHYALTAALAPCDYGAAFDGVAVGVSSQMGGCTGRPDNATPYAIAYGVQPARHMSGDWLDLRTARLLASAAALVDRRMLAALADMGGSGESLADVCVALAHTVRASWYFTRGQNREAFEPEGLRSLIDSRHARQWISEQIATLAARLYPDASQAA